MNNKAKEKANEIFNINKNLIQTSFASPFTNGEIREMICAFDLSISFCEIIISSFKWFNFKEKVFYKDVRTFLIERKLCFFEEQNERLKDEVKKYRP